MRGQKRGVAERVVANIQGLDPPGRFLIEDPSSTGEGGKDLAKEDGNAVGEMVDGEGKKSAVHRSILSKRWVVVDHAKAIAKVLHRLREKDPTSAGAASPANANAKAPLSEAAAGSGEKGGLIEKKEGDNPRPLLVCKTYD